MKDKKVFTLAETQKNISLATYRGRGIKGEGVTARHSEETKVTEESLACHCEEQPNNSFLPFIRGGLRRGDSSFETPIIKVFQKKKKDITSSPALPLKEGKGATAFTLSCKTFRSDSSQAKLTQSPAQSSQTKFRYAHSYGFTLAETLIVLVILGVVAAITIPALVRNQIEAQNRTRIKKAMTVYDMALNKMVVENNLKSNDALYSSNPNDNTAFAPQGNCTRTSAYFKINRTLNNDNGTNCRFCSSDNVCWDISNILKPIIGIGEEGITNENSNNRYRMFAHFGDNGELRVDDVAYEQNHDYLTDDEKEELTALYNFANNKKSSSGEVAQKSPFDECKEKGQDTCTVNGITYTPKQFTAQCADFPSWADAKHKGTQSCGTTGTFWVAELGYPEDYDTQATSDENCATSTYGWCKDDGDYYNAAKRYCESSGGHLPTIGELISGGYTDGNFWAAEEYDSTYVYYLYNGDVNTYSKLDNHDVVCVGN